MKKTIIVLLFPLFCFGQTQIGSNINGEAANDYSGRSVSLSSNGNIIAIGASQNNGSGTDDAGHVRVYQNVSGVWSQIGADIDGEANVDLSGVCVSLSSNGNIVAIGANANDGNGNLSGHVRLYQNVSGVWTQIGADIDGEASYDQSGESISLSSDGSIVAIGARYNGGNGTNSGHVRVYRNISGVWTKIGADINGEAENDYSGYNIALSSDGSIVAIGAAQNDGGGTDSGHVRVYQNVSGVWTKIGADINGEAANDQSGRSVALSSDGSIVAIGARLNDGNGTDSGHVRIYRNVSGVWTKIGSDINGEAANDYSGHSVCLSADGSILAIGAYQNDGNGTDSGHVRVYRNISGVWTKIGSDINGEAAGDYCGYGISLSSDGGILAVGSNYNDGNGTNSGHVRVYNLNGILASDSFAQSKSSPLLFPNPVKDFLNLSYDKTITSVVIYNMIGQQVFVKELNAKEFKIDTSNLVAGTYLVKVTSDNEVKTFKIVKK
ncbi:T9SS type A sorting domain-containing protein [Chryseobacterium sp. Leaf201]|uniref:T9SS type A sorting domain-containing protein n=1 Tax=Chryseobacterium sp. Leaf201 TaxID=1735672 RepID=UPI0006F253B9|nr:T9SS type A sorting domain-containing protein [Chryseobacterium sp. Leaf201]KQM62564.1 hypothetical protein ASE55_06485 [Chryseobacterium sp. Leaf201]